MPLKAVALSDQIADHLAEQIIHGTLPPGARLHENELAKQLDVSTNSLREAFRLLEARHLIEIQPRRGARVREVTEAQVQELYDFLFLMLSELAGRAAKVWQPGELDELARMLPQLEQLHQAGDIAGAHQMVFRFLPHMLVFARNAYMARAISDLIPLLQRYSYIALIEETSEFDMSLQIFQRLLVNVVARQAEAASADILEYGDNQCRIVLRALHKRNATPVAAVQ